MVRKIHKTEDAGVHTIWNLYTRFNYDSKIGRCCSI